MKTGKLNGTIWTTSPVSTGYIRTALGLMGFSVLIFQVSDAIANTDE